MRFPISFCLGLLISLILADSIPLLAQEQSSPAFAVHVVQRGENLFRIALQYNLLADDLADANGISDINAISIGQRLIIPLEAESAPAQRAHTIAAGETLASIATSYEITLDALLRLNDLSLSDAIFVGQQLRLPPDESAGGAPAAAEATETVESGGSTTTIAQPTSLAPSPHSFARVGAPPAVFVHAVASGDTLSQIALRYKQTVNALASANNIRDPSLLRIGQRLTIPGIQLPRLTSDLPEIVTAFTIDPLVFEEGRTGRIELLTSEPAVLSGQFLGQELRVIAREGGRRHNILVGIPMFSEMAVFPLLLELRDASDTVFSISATLQVVSGGYWRQSITISDDELLAPAVEDAEISMLVGLTSGFGETRYWVSSLSLPAAAPMNAVFGTLRSYNGSPFDRYHRGVDFAGAPGTSVLAAADGTVILADRLILRGNTTVIDHGWGVYTLYAHQNETLVQPGDSVTTGQVIGTIGSTGRSTGPHLHWEVWLNGINVDPMQWVRQTFP